MYSVFTCTLHFASIIGNGTPNSNIDSSEGASLVLKDSNGLLFWGGRREMDSSPARHWAGLLALWTAFRLFHPLKPPYAGVTRLHLVKGSRR